MTALSIFRTYNARVESGVVKRGRLVNDWFQYGLYYGEPRYLEIHEFDNWSLIVFDESALGKFQASDFSAPVLIYLAYGSKFRQYAVRDGDAAPAYSVSGIEDMKAMFRSKIDWIMDTHQCGGIFWDECDSAYWDVGRTFAGNQAMRDALLDLCNYVRAKGGQSIINGTPWFAKVGEIFLLESFVGSYHGNAFVPSWRFNRFFTPYSFALEDGEACGIGWGSGILPYLYVWKYGYAEGDFQTLQFGHAYGDPLSPFQNERQTQVYAAFQASGIASVNYIDPTNQHMLHLYMHRHYLGAPLNMPQFDVGNETISRHFSGGNVFYDDRDPTQSQINRNLSPDAWWKVDRPFEPDFTQRDPVPWDSEGQSYPTSTFEDYNYVPDYLQIEQITSWDDREQLYIRIQFAASFPESDILPVFLYLNIDDSQPGLQQFVSIASGRTFLEFADLKAQAYIYADGLFLWNGASPSDFSWQYLYQIRHAKRSVAGKDVVYYAIRKETLRFAQPGWDGSSIRFLFGFAGNTGSGFQVLEAIEQVVETGNQYLRVNGYLEHTMQMPIAYVPHNAVIFSATGQPGNKITQVDITGSFHHARIFDRATGEFIGPDGTIHSSYATASFAPPREIDASDIYVLVDYEHEDVTDDGFAVSAVNVATESWAGSHDAAYDVPLPHLLAWQPLYEQWKEVRVPNSETLSFTPLGIKRGEITFAKDRLTESTTIRVAMNDTIQQALEVDDIIGSEVILRRIEAEADFTNPDAVETLIHGIIEKWEMDDAQLILTLRQNMVDWQSAYPNRRVSYLCPYVFKDSRCGYEGLEGSCDKTLPTCQSYGNDVNFGGFPTLPRLQRGKWQ